MQDPNRGNAFGDAAIIPMYRWLCRVDRSEGLEPGKVRLLFIFD
jgi:hypothetical protein